MKARKTGILVVASALYSLVVTGCAPEVDYSQFKVDSCSDTISSNGGSVDAAISIVSAPNASFTDVEHLSPTIGSSISPYLQTRTLINSVIAGQSSRLSAQLILDKSGDIFGSNARQDEQLAIQGIVESQKCLEGPEHGQETELDLLGAIGFAAATIRQSEPQASKTIFVFSNGLQTVGDFDLRTSMEIGSKNLANQLAAREAIPDLHGFTLVFYGLGQTTGDYPRFTASSKERVTDIWREISRMAGAEFVDRGPVSTGDANPQGSFVSPVQPLRAPAIFKSCSSTLTDANLSFYPNSSIFVDPQGARTTVGELVDQAQSHDCGTKYHVVGFTTNFGSINQQHRLSQQRAQAVAALLMELSPNAVLEVEGRGYDGSGGLNQENRRVDVSITSY